MRYGHARRVSKGRGVRLVALISTTVTVLLFLPGVTGTALAVVGPPSPLAGSITTTPANGSTNGPLAPGATEPVTGYTLPVSGSTSASNASVHAQVTSGPDAGPQVLCAPETPQASPPYSQPFRCFGSGLHNNGTAGTDTVRVYADNVGNATYTSTDPTSTFTVIFGVTAISTTPANGSTTSVPTRGSTLPISGYVTPVGATVTIYYQVTSGPDTPPPPVSCGTPSPSTGYFACTATPFKNNGTAGTDTVRVFADNAGTGKWVSTDPTSTFTLIFGTLATAITTTPADGSVTYKALSTPQSVTAFIAPTGAQVKVWEQVKTGIGTWQTATPCTLSLGVFTCAQVNSGVMAVYTVRVFADNVGSPGTPTDASTDPTSTFAVVFGGVTAITTSPANGSTTGLKTVRASQAISGSVSPTGTPVGVYYQVTAGPDSGNPVSCGTSTSATGAFICPALKNNGTAGADTVQVFADDAGTGTFVTGDPVSKFTLVFGATGIVTVPANGSTTSTMTVGQTQPISGTATPTGTNVAIYYQVTSGPDAGGLVACATPIATTGAFTCPGLTNRGVSGADTVQVFADNQGTAVYAAGDPVSVFTLVWLPETPTGVGTTRAIVTGPIGLHWRGTFNGVSYNVQMMSAPYDGTFETPTTIATGVSSTSYTYNGKMGSTYCFRVAAVDAHGSVSPYSGWRCSGVALDDRALFASKAWKRGTGGGFWQQTYSVTSRAGAWLQLKGAQFRKLFVIVKSFPGGGTLGVYLNGHLLRKVSTYSGRPIFRAQRWILSSWWVRTGTITIKVLSGTVVVDGLGLARM